MNLLLVSVMVWAKSAKLKSLLEICETIETHEHWLVVREVWQGQFVFAALQR